MRRLLLMRHGKSDRDGFTGSDRARPLAPRGRRAARVMAVALHRMGETPDAVVASPALRASSTAAILAEEWGVDVVEDEGLYGGGEETVLASAAGHGGDARRLLLVGHDPTWSGLVRRLTGARAPLRTASVAAIDLEVTEWAALPGSRGTLAWLLHPRLFTDGAWAL